MYSVRCTSQTARGADAERDFLRTAIDVAERRQRVYHETYGVFRTSDDFEMYSTGDSPELKKYLSHTGDEWKSLDGINRDTQEKPSVYFDIDGTLGYWYEDRRGMSYPEEVLDPKNHYFRNIAPHSFMIELANTLQERGADVCIMSAADRDTIRDKWEWIQEHMPFVKEENIFFCPIGADKTEFVKGNAERSVLVDDYPKNLREWSGYAVKAINSVNTHQDIFPEIDGIRAETSGDEKTWNAVLCGAVSDIEALLDASLLDIDAQECALDDVIAGAEEKASVSNADRKYVEREDGSR